ncbi:hypothetical protein OH76DRAFT_1005556 [Lentinus brumalis]|uniref:Uncharacterized protein n=1 Tax=Lentinus brumalis TaxID=2498619 RepID=A0A371CYM0_9APHY|nr:hypothetical protein OH76DRAFT_1005556 [Polyporus brumalis]
MYSLVSESASSDSLSTTFPARTSSRPLRRPSRVNHRLTPCPPHCPNLSDSAPGAGALVTVRIKTAAVGHHGRCVACTDLSSPAARTAQALRRTPPPRAPSATLLTCRRRGEHTYANNYVVYVPRADACSMEAYPHCLHTRATLLRERHPHGPSISAVAQTAMHSLVSSSSEPLSTT